MLSPEGVDRIASVQPLAGRIDQPRDQGEIAAALVDVEGLIEAPDPELQGVAHQSADPVRRKLELAAT